MQETSDQRLGHASTTISMEELRQAQDRGMSGTMMPGIRDVPPPPPPSIFSASGPLIPTHDRPDPYTRALQIWGTAHVKKQEDVTWIGHIGSRNDDLLFWKSRARVATGWQNGNGACWESSLDEFAKRVGETYGEADSELHRRCLREYRLAVTYFRAISSGEST